MWESRSITHSLTHSITHSLTSEEASSAAHVQNATNKFIKQQCDRRMRDQGLGIRVWPSDQPLRRPNACAKSATPASTSWPFHLKSDAQLTR